MQHNASRVYQIAGRSTRVSLRYGFLSLYHFRPFQVSLFALFIALFRTLLCCRTVHARFLSSRRKARISFMLLTFAKNVEPWSLTEFLFPLNGLAAKCGLGEETISARPTHRMCDKSAWSRFLNL